MTPDDQVIVIGGDDDPGPSRPRPPRRFSPYLIFVPVVGLFLAVIAFVVTPQVEPPTTAEPSGIDAPPEPPRAFVSTTALTIPDEVPLLATGWKEVDLPGRSWGLVAIDAGEPGWLAVAEGQPPLAYVSTDAVLWQARTLHGLEGHAFEASVGERSMAVVGSWVGDYSFDRDTSAVSTDGGRSWRTYPVDTLANSWIATIQHVGDVLFAAGSRAPAPDSPFGDRGTAEVWRFNGQSWDRGSLNARVGSQVTAIVEGPDGAALAFGHDRDGLAAWTLDPEVGPHTFEPPADGSTIGFLDVERRPDGSYVAVVGPVGGLGTAIWESGDLVRWTEVSDWRVAVNDVTITDDGSLLAVEPSDGNGLWAQTPTGPARVRTRYSDVVTGRESSGWVDAVEGFDDRIVVVGGSDDGRSQMYVRGTTVTPLALAGTPPPQDLSWKEVAAVPIDPGNDWGSLSVAQSGDESFVLADGRVFQVFETEGVLSIVESLPAAQMIGVGPSGVWAANPSGSAGTQLFTYGRDGVWSTQLVPVGSVMAVSELGGALSVIASEPVMGGATVWTFEDGSWQETAGGITVWAGAAVPGGFLVSRPVDSPDNVFGQEVVFSSDGLTWTPVGVRLGVPWLGGVPLLYDPDEPSSIKLADRWPDHEDVRFDRPPMMVSRFGDDLWLLAPGDLTIRSADGSERSHPVDIEHGVEGLAAILPSAEPTLVELTDGEVRILRLAP